MPQAREQDHLDRPDQAPAFGFPDANGASHSLKQRAGDSEHHHLHLPTTTRTHFRRTTESPTFARGSADHRIHMLLICSKTTRSSSPSRLPQSDFQPAYVRVGRSRRSRTFASATQEVAHTYAHQATQDVSLLDRNSILRLRDAPVARLQRARSSTLKIAAPARRHAGIQLEPGPQPTPSRSGPASNREPYAPRGHRFRSSTLPACSVRRRFPSTSTSTVSRARSRPSSRPSHTKSRFQLRVDMKRLAPMFFGSSWTHMVRSLSGRARTGPRSPRAGRGTAARTAQIAVRSFPASRSYPLSSWSILPAAEPDTSSLAPRSAIGIVDDALKAALGQLAHGRGERWLRSRLFGVKTISGLILRRAWRRAGGSTGPWS